MMRILLAVITLCGCLTDDRGSGGVGGPITGTWRTTFVADNGKTERPIDLSAVTIEAIVGDRTFPGVGTVDGTFTIPDGPAGEYLLRVHNRFFATSERTLTLDDAQHGRPDTRVAKPGTGLTFNVSGLDAWTDGDVFEMFVSNNGTFLFNLETVIPHAAGVTAFTGGVDYVGSAFPAPGLIESAKGDVAHFVQLTNRNVGGVAIQALAKSGTVTGIVQLDGASTPIAATLAAVPQTSTFALDFRRSQFAALTPAGATAELSLFGVQAQPPELASELVAAADLVLGTYPPDRIDLAPGPVNFGDPYPASWTRFLAGLVQSSISLTVPGTSNAVRIPLTNHVEQAPGGPLQPFVGPATNIRIDLETTTARWDAPTLGTNLWYEVFVRQLSASTETRDGASTETVAMITTPDRIVTIPNGILKSGQHYFLHVSSYATSSPVPPPRRPARPYGRADALGAVFTVP